MIKFEKVTKRFGDIIALEDISFNVAPGELVFLTGPSGAGKTTLVRLILREIEPTSGKIFLMETELGSLKAKDVFALRRKTGVVFQDFKLLLDRTVRENVVLALEVVGSDGKKAPQKVETVLEEVGLLERADLFPSQLAGGELQRACLARALVTEPELLIADEPTGNLDIATAWQIVSLFKKINQQGKTVLISTHNFEIVDSLKSRVIELSEGKLIRDEKKGRYRAR